MQTKHVIKIYTDGACNPNPGPGGWGFYCELPGGQVRHSSGAEKSTTNNRMEMMGAIKALESLSDKELNLNIISIYTDSKYLKNGITTWIKNWKRKNWKTASNKPVKNQDLWMQLDQLTGTKGALIRWQWVKGHSGNPGNEIADKLATEAIESA